MTPRKQNEVASTEQRRVVMLSGPVGAGKTTVARLLLPILPGPWAYLEGDTFWSFIAKGENRSKRENFQVIMRSMTAAAVPFARSEFGVLLDFSIPPDFLPTAQKILKGLPLDFIVLRPTLEICARRAAERKEGKITNYGPYKSFYALFKGRTPATIDDTAGEDARSRSTFGMVWRRIDSAFRRRQKDAFCDRVPPKDGYRYNRNFLHNHAFPRW